MRKPIDRGVRIVLVGALTLQLAIQAVIVLNLSVEGPERPHVVLVVATFLGTAAVAAATLWVLTRGPAWVAGLTMVVVLAAAIELLPEKIDSHESFLDRPNERKACHGLVYTSYPYGTFDASETVWCIGWETTRPPG